MKISGGETKEDLVRAKMPRYSSGKGNKRSASQPPAKEPPAKAHALSARISSMDKALMFGEDNPGMNVTGLIENALNEIVAAGCDVMSQGVFFIQKSQNLFYFFDESQSEKMGRKMRIEFRYASE